MAAEDCSNEKKISNAHKDDHEELQTEPLESNPETADDANQRLNLDDEDQESEPGSLVSV